MSKPLLSRHRPLRSPVAALLACVLLPGAAFADDGDETLGVVSPITLPAQAKATPPSWAGKAFRQGVVSVANPYGAEAGARMLEAGGNAVDAAIAIAYALNVVEPQSAGIGGGGFMMIHLADSRRTFAIDTREKAPAGATPTMFVGVPNPTLQGVAVGVPGMVRGSALALQRYGRLPLAQVIEPAIQLADQGFAATPRYSAASCNSRGRLVVPVAGGTIDGAASYPRNEETFTRLVAAFTLEKALYELRYEVANRPDWIAIPLDAILELVAGT